MASTPATTIPEELIALILSKLPIKYLLRSISVCKRWRSIISDPQFHKRNSLFLVARHGNYPTYYTIDDESSIKYLEDLGRKVTGTRSNFKNYSFVTNSCNGLVLIGIDESLFLFNPLTRYFQKVLTLDCLRNYSYSVNPGFCYDASASDYKAVLGISHRYGEGGFVNVASLREKNWDQISIEPFNAGTLCGGPVVNGRMHWTARKNVSANRVIIWFDARKNVFEELTSPNPKDGDSNAIVGLGILDGCLCMARSDFEGSVEVLMMKEYGVSESWTSMFIVPNASVDRYKGDFTPLLVKKNGDVIVRIDNRVISVYSVSTGLMMNVGFPINSEPVYVASFKETLVSPLTTVGV